jgi:serine/threonine protein kinase
LVERLAVGGMAEVWRVECEGEPPAVLKRVRPVLAEQPAMIDAFKYEGKLALKLQHPNIVRAIELGEHEGTPFLVLERVDGVDLVELIRSFRGARIEPGLAAAVAAQVCRALSYLHAFEKGFVHRDVSSSNVMIGFDGVVKLIDFGIAKRVIGEDTRTGSRARTEPGQIKGKLGFMAPEQSRGGPVDARTDVYAAGVLLHHLATGKRDGEIADLELAKIHRTATATEPDDRFANAARMADALEPLAWDSQKLARFCATLAMPEGSTAATGQLERPRRFGLIAGLCAATAAIAIAAWLVWANRAQPPAPPSAPPLPAPAAIDPPELPPAAAQPTPREEHAPRPKERRKHKREIVNPF